ncbi:MAG TPA: histone deacetylase [Algoriphagus sp.]|jgi:acetoin utilization deacetylase AcuC-like enzyme|uniref:histone deacetylase family protein n=1 Tax=unclassified Algoriphagus TaxID=2641541 RepID=UPI000C6AE09A|nr:MULTISPECIES: histone deacetylase [unclassified Algoriphagus]MAL13263.1 histone deacetylase [Algoriphagus sp.]MAN85410.1 histone deacetylase [Algoriphagus sp.]HAD50883.1 histone deacetylase [Algoriphagus sp.]HAH35547.1 histone deacetylase [Algoriphagus sp.]HAS57658.1 histone deacetylase [Algoriphagus sp.]|tara:strand:+ start:439 stop:1341 length:903 start_codon:yes stop_codon:yes gene_type:complete
MLKIAWSSEYAHPLPPGHRFPMEKYELLPQQLMYEGTVSERNFFAPDAIDESLIVQVHDAQYWEKLKNLALSRSEERATGFPLSKELVNRETIIAGGSVRAALFALEYGISLNIAGGTHHAFTDRGEGFCLLNDIALASRYLQNEGLAKNILVIDLDVHQGNGTAQIFKDDPSVFTFSMHGAKNYPHRKEKSDMDIELPDGTGDEEYLTQLDLALENILKKFHPDFIMYQCGVDVLETDKLGRLGMSIEGVKMRDKKVLNLAKELKLPIMCSMGGGYSEKISHIIEAHAQVYRLAQDIFF